MVKIASAGDTPSQTRLRQNLRVLIAAAKDSGHTQGSIARAAGLHPSSVSLILRGRRSVTLAVIEALAPLLGTTTEAVLQREFTDPASVSRDTLLSPDSETQQLVLRVLARVLLPQLSEAEIRAFNLLHRSLPKPPTSGKTPAHSGHRLTKVVDTPAQQTSRG
jgi:transcriptional regulator with XRE-family HTH domain